MNSLLSFFLCLLVSFCAYLELLSSTYSYIQCIEETACSLVLPLAWGWSMPLFPKNDGTVVSQAPMAIDRRWIMSYAAGVGDPNPAHYRAEDSGGLIAHPCMYWAISWHQYWIHLYFLTLQLSRLEAIGRKWTAFQSDRKQHRACSAPESSIEIVSTKV